MIVSGDNGLEVDSAEDVWAIGVRPHRILRGHVQFGLRWQLRC
jgi:hypothetical protein